MGITRRRRRRRRKEEKKYEGVVEWWLLQRVASCLLGRAARVCRSCVWFISSIPKSRGWFVWFGFWVTLDNSFSSSAIFSIVFNKDTATYTLVHCTCAPVFPLITGGSVFNFQFLSPFCVSYSTRIYYHYFFFSIYLLSFFTICFSGLVFLILFFFFK